MNRTKAIALFTAVFAVTVGILGMNGLSATSFGIIPATTSTAGETQDLLGHVTYILRDEDGNIKSYLQSDNVVATRGKDCATQMLFGNTTAPAGGCVDASGTTTGFNYIAIGNATGQSAAAADTALDSSGGGLPAGGAEIKRNQGAVAFGSNQATITSQTFSFNAASDNTAGTTVSQSGLFDGATSGAANSNMFSIQDISIAVGSSDTLQVTWTITLS